MKFHYRLSLLILRGFARAAWGFRRNGTDLIPASGPVIIASNHISNWDPILVGLGCRRELHFMAKEELFRNPCLAVIVRALNAFPIRRGMLDRRALRAASGVLDDGKVLLMFPGGTRDRSGEVRDPKSGVGFIASKHEAPVVPAYISCPNSLARAFITRKRMQVTFGPPIVASKARSSDDYRVFAQRIADEIGRLKPETDEQ
ncbi:MAG: 1-acyl-sn-glycerol-3-phosphate acyltransferase [Candidatus Eisenbacteria sp.]|nr:1-acyl-sn-glycerol-3-phosphate acyltransferase [Candidatus Eisenbacteria bacterium]